ncbi:MAG: hypothetical protein WC967_14710 [Balneolaceae bacterium]
MATKKTKTAFLKPLTVNSMAKGAGCFAIRGVSAIVANATSSKASNIMPKAHGFVALALGLGADMLIENDYARAPFEGIGTWGAIRVAQDFVPQGSSLRTHLGLGNTDNQEDTTVVDSTPDWDALAREMNIEVDEAPEYDEEEMAAQEAAAMADFDEAAAQQEVLNTLPI